MSCKEVSHLFKTMSWTAPLRCTKEKIFFFFSFPTKQLLDNAAYGSPGLNTKVELRQARSPSDVMIINDSSAALTAVYRVLPFICWGVINVPDERGSLTDSRAC